MRRSLVVATWVLCNLAVVAGGIYWGVSAGDPGAEFEEDGRLTWVSAAQLGFTGVLLAGGAGLRSLGGERPLVHRFVRSGAPWAMLAAVFFLMAADEAMALHERLDMRIHAALGLIEGPLTDRLDDVLLAGYAAVGAAVVVVWRHELRVCAPAAPVLAAALAASAVMLAADVVTNRDDMLSWVIADGERRENVWVALSIAEDALKLVAGGLFAACAWIALGCLSRHGDAAG